MTGSQTASPRISLNTDIGEGFGVYEITDDEALLALVSDANVACGFHGGDPRIMRRTCESAAARGLAVGAHFGFADRRGFGRRHIEMPPDDLRDDIVYQIGGLHAIAAAAGTRVSYVKAHGALYHSAMARPEYAAAMFDGIEQSAPGLPLLCQPGTALADEAAERGIRVLREGYVDRGVEDDGRLMPRGRPGALVTDPSAAAARAIQMVLQGTVETASGATIAMPVDSLCLHSDTPGAVQTARQVRSALEAAGVIVAPMV